MFSVFISDHVEHYSRLEEISKYTTFLKFVPREPINNRSILFQVMAKHRTDREMNRMLGPQRYNAPQYN